jgi:HPt (histidine-containing phosphotransfer) domain-containing protein
VSEPPISLEALAAIAAELEGALDRSVVLERRGLGEAAFEAALRELQATIAAADAAGDPEPGHRWQTALAAARGARRSATTVRDRSRVKPRPRKD